MKTRCPWAGNNDLMIEYHDAEWGRQVKDDRTLFEFLILEGAQAGLSWLSILTRREGYRKAFHAFDPSKLAQLTDAQLDQIVLGPGIIRNRAKVYSVRTNAQAFLRIQAEQGSFYQYLYSFMPDGKRIENHRPAGSQLPVLSNQAEAISKDLKKRGVSFFGPVICYAFMQATGMVDDHFEDCFIRMPSQA